MTLAEILASLRWQYQGVRPLNHGTHTDRQREETQTPNPPPSPPSNWPDDEPWEEAEWRDYGWTPYTTTYGPWHMHEDDGGGTDPPPEPPPDPPDDDPPDDDPPDDDPPDDDPPFTDEEGETYDPGPWEGEGPTQRRDVYRVTDGGDRIFAYFETRPNPDYEEPDEDPPDDDPPDDGDDEDGEDGESDGGTPPDDTDDTETADDDTEYAVLDQYEDLATEENIAGAQALNLAEILDAEERARDAGGLFSAYRTGAISNVETLAIAHFVELRLEALDRGEAVSGDLDSFIEAELAAPEPRSTELRLFDAIASLRAAGLSASEIRRLLYRTGYSTAIIDAALGGRVIRRRGRTDTDYEGVVHDVRIFRDSRAGTVSGEQNLLLRLGDEAAPQDPADGLVQQYGAATQQARETFEAEHEYLTAEQAQELGIEGGAGYYNREGLAGLRTFLSEREYLSAEEAAALGLEAGEGYYSREGLERVRLYQGSQYLTAEQAEALGLEEGEGSYSRAILDTLPPGALTQALAPPAPAPDEGSLSNEELDELEGRITGTIDPGRVQYLRENEYLTTAEAAELRLEDGAGYYPREGIAARRAFYEENVYVGGDEAQRLGLRSGPGNYERAAIERLRGLAEYPEGTIQTQRLVPAVPRGSNLDPLFTLTEEVQPRAGVDVPEGPPLPGPRGLVTPQETQTPAQANRSEIERVNRNLDALLRARDRLLSQGLSPEPLRGQIELLMGQLEELRNPTPRTADGRPVTDAYDELLDEYIPLRTPRDDELDAMLADLSPRADNYRYLSELRTDPENQQRLRDRAVELLTEIQQEEAELTSLLESPAPAGVDPDRWREWLDSVRSSVASAEELGHIYGHADFLGLTPAAVRRSTEGQILGLDGNPVGLPDPRSGDAPLTDVYADTLIATGSEALALRAYREAVLGQEDPEGFDEIRAIVDRANDVAGLRDELGSVILEGQGIGRGEQLFYDSYILGLLPAVGEVQDFLEASAIASRPALREGLPAAFQRLLDLHPAAFVAGVTAVSALSPMGVVAGGRLGARVAHGLLDRIPPIDYTIRGELVSRQGGRQLTMAEMEPHRAFTPGTSIARPYYVDLGDGAYFRIYETPVHPRRVPPQVSYSPPRPDMRPDYRPLTAGAPLPAQPTGENLYDVLGGPEGFLEHSAIPNPPDDPRAFAPQPPIPEDAPDFAPQPAPPDSITLYHGTGRYFLGPPSRSEGDVLGTNYVSLTAGSGGG